MPVVSGINWTYPPYGIGSRIGKEKRMRGESSQVVSKRISLSRKRFAHIAVPHGMRFWTEQRANW